MANVSDFPIYVSLSNQPQMTKPTLKDLNPDEHNQGLCEYPYMVNLGRYNL